MRFSEIQNTYRNFFQYLLDDGFMYNKSEYLHNQIVRKNRYQVNI